jgi:hypothetical protein
MLETAGDTSAEPTERPMVGGTIVALQRHAVPSSRGIRLLGSVLMRSRRLVVVIVASVLTLPVFPPTTALARDLPGPCDLHARDGETITHLMKRTIRCAVRRLGPVPGGAERAICIARRESGLNPEATSSTGKYRGLFQHARKYWDWRYDSFTRQAWELPERALHGRTNAVVTIRMVRRYDTWADAGWPVKRCR